MIAPGVHSLVDEGSARMRLAMFDTALMLPPGQNGLFFPENMRHVQLERDSALQFDFGGSRVFLGHFRDLERMHE